MGQTAITFGAGATYPFDTVRHRLQMQSEKPPEEHLYKGTMHCFKKIAQEEGMASGLYKGFLANVVRSVGGALVLVFYDRAKNALVSEACLWSLLSTGMCWHASMAP